MGMEHRWESVRMDLIGPFPASRKKHKYVYVMTCLFSKFVYARAVPDKSVQSVSKALTKMCHLYGPPKQLVTDLGQKHRNQVS